MNFWFLYFLTTSFSPLDELHELRTQDYPQHVVGRAIASSDRNVIDALVKFHSMKVRVITPPEADISGNLVDRTITLPIDY